MTLAPCARMRDGMPATIRRIESAEAPVITGLCTLLVDAVHDGASVGFLAPMSQERALGYWQPVIAGLHGGMVLWVAESEGQVVGTVQLALTARRTAAIGPMCKSCWF